MELDVNKTNWKILYRIGAVCAFLVLLVMVTEMFLTALPDGARTPLTITGWFDLFNRNWFMGMRNLGLINIIATTLMIPVFFSIFGLHRKENSAFAGLSLIIFMAGYAIFMADNTSFPMLELSRKYAIADLESKRILLAAGESLLAKGSSHTPGTFPGFFLAEAAGILFCIVMLQGKVFSKATGIVGIIAFGFMFLFEVSSSFIHALYDISIVFAMMGGILTFVWYVMIGLRLLKVSR
ncbi:MAG TPA: hypothetical protein DCK87_06080 [Desulfotomaculum sp.]|nr:hypothetical protein [Desulfotomaculum sp.]